MRPLALLAALALTLLIAACGTTPLPPLFRSESERQAEATRELHQGMRSLSLGDRDLADRHLLQAALLYGVENQGFVRVAQRLLDEGECDRAGLLLEQASLLPEYRTDPFVFHVLAQASRSKGDLPQAETLEKKAQALVAQVEQPVPTPNDTALQNRVRQLLLTGRYALEVQHKSTLGIGLLRLAVSLKPRPPLDNIALGTLGAALAENPTLADFPQEALQCTRQAALAELDNAALRHGYGWALFRSGDTEGALRVLREAADLDQCNPEIHFHLGLVYLARGAQERATRELDCALRLWPHYTDAERTRKSLPTPVQSAGAGQA